MKKLFLLLVILWVWYMISIFLAPSFADKIGDILWIKSFNEKIRNNWGDFNRIFTDIPTTNELEEWYNNVINKAKEFGNDVSSWIDKTKDTIDSIRTTLSWAEDKINKVKKTYTKLEETYDNTVKKAEEFKKTYNDIEKIWNSINNIVSTGTVNWN